MLKDTKSDTQKKGALKTVQSDGFTRFIAPIGKIASKKMIRPSRNVEGYYNNCQM